ncbi:MAG: hypothetical protein EPN23_00605 [Verrucomicrobia bacterium]|nr:MAG: hypothetical protein EPN23_00605 [Verrucomicrobiota bacterium]
MSAPTADNENLLVTSYFKTQAVPYYGEYIFNSFRWAVSRWQFELGDGGLEQRLEKGLQSVGDGVVPVWSQEGRSGPGSDPDIMYGAYNAIRPLIFGKTTDPNQFADWVHFHKGETEIEAALLKSLCGAVYTDSNVNPNSHGENFSKYLSLQDWLSSGGEWSTIVHSDEPGLRDLILLCETGAHDNPFVIPALNTWDTDGYSPPQNMYTDRTNLIDHQIIGGAGAQLRVIGMTGAKNCAETPFGSASDGEYNYYWAKDGNEYLPASLGIQFTHDSQADINAAPIQNFQSGLVDSCLTILDGKGAPHHQYGLFDQILGDISLNQSSAPIYFFAQGKNLAALNTPITERGFEVPVSSADLKWIMCAINEREKAAGLEPTHWTQWVTEWVDVPAGAESFTLNFFPTWNPNEYGLDLEDAFTKAGYYDWTDYDESSGTFTIPASDAPRCLKVDYQAYLGGLDSFMTNYDGSSAGFTVPALDDADANILAGVPVDANLIGRLQRACEGLLSYYADHEKAGGGAFTQGYIPVWGTANRYDSSTPPKQTVFSIFEAAVPGAAGDAGDTWRRKGAADTAFHYGSAQPDDRIGPWCCEDLKKVLLLLRWSMLSLNMNLTSAQGHGEGRGVSNDCTAAVAQYPNGTLYGLLYPTYGMLGAFVDAGYDSRYYQETLGDLDFYEIYRSYGVISSNLPKLHGSVGLDVYFYVAEDALLNGDDFKKGFHRQKTILYNGSGSPPNDVLGDAALAIPEHPTFPDGWGFLGYYVLPDDFIYVLKAYDAFRYR